MAEISATEVAATAEAGDTVYLGRETPQQWENPGTEPARLLWITIY
jgi:mannose-6-phosphate isomerase-like protein (cupin superfamily)